MYKSAAATCGISTRVGASPWLDARAGAAAHRASGTRTAASVSERAAARGAAGVRESMVFLPFEFAVIADPIPGPLGIQVLAGNLQRGSARRGAPRLTAAPDPCRPAWC